MNYNGNHRWTAGAGTTVTAGIAAGAAGLSLLNNGGLGGIFGGGCNNSLQKENSALLAEVGQLKAEKSTDEKLLARDNQYKNDLERFYGRFENAAGELATLKADHQCMQKQLTDYAIHQEKIDELQRALLRKDIEGVNKDLNCLAGKVEAGFRGINNRFAGIDATIASFTQTAISERVICDTGRSRSNCPQQ
jgi:SMC interacting uncharacterized protein involved in chromosome segregation